jgi:c-di-GMP-binding flagellar brake protein YcgR
MSYQHIILQLESAGQRKWLNRRVTVRYQCPPATVGKVFAEAREAFYRVWVLDLSKGGAGILLDRSLPAGQQITVQISSPTNQKLEFPARVAHAREQSSGEWFVGLEFVRPLTEDEMDALLN